MITATRNHCSGDAAETSVFLESTQVTDGIEAAPAMTWMSS